MKHAGMFAAIGAGRWRRRRLAILMYHGVSIEDEHAWDPGLYLSPERFRGSLETIRRSGCTVLPLRDAVNRLYDGSLPDRAVALTFDDGNFDFAHRAVPVLEEFDYPATVFVSTYYSYFQRPVFDPALANILWRGRGRSIPASGLAIGSEPISTAEPEDRAVSWRRIHGFTRQEQMSGEAKHELLAHVAEKLEVDLEAMMASRMFYLMRPDELAVLPPELIDVQLHTHRHRTPRDRDTFLDEIADNRTGLRGALGDEARLDQFCYPSGDYVRDYVPWLEQVGVEVAVTTDSGLASPESHRLLLPRVAVTSGMASVELEAWLTGARKLLPRIH